MVSLVLGMLFCVLLALAVVALVAVPARRAGREVLTERGEEFLGSIRDRQLLPGRPGAAEPADGDDPEGREGPVQRSGARNDEALGASA